MSYPAPSRDCISNKPSVESVRRALRVAQRVAGVGGRSFSHRVDLLLAFVDRHHHDVARPRCFQREGRHGLPQRRELGEFLEGSGRWGERSCVEILTRLNSRPNSGPFQPRFPALILSPDLGPAQLQPQRQNQPSLDPGLRSHSRSRSPKP